MDNLKLINEDNNNSIIIDGEFWEDILKITYKRKYLLFEILKSHTEYLEGKNFRMNRVNYMEKKYKK